MIINRFFNLQTNLRCCGVQFRRCSSKIDFFGINDLNSKVLAGQLTLTEHSVSKLKAKIKKFSFAKRYKLDKDETSHVTTFGSVRYDRENLTKYHGQYEEENENVQNIFDDWPQSNQELNDECIEVSIASSHETISEANDGLTKLVDVQETSVENSKNSNIDHNVYHLNDEDKLFFKEKYFLSPDLTNDLHQTLPANNFYFHQDWEKFCQELENSEPETHSPKSVPRIDEKLVIFEGINNDSPLKSLDDVFKELTLIKSESNEEKCVVDDASYQKEEKPFVLKTPLTAFEYIQQIKNGQRVAETFNLRKQMEPKVKAVVSDINLKRFCPSGVKTDSFGFRNYSDQVFDLSQLRKEELIWYLKKRVIFNENDLVALDKPYGLKCHGSETNEQTVCLEELLPDLAKLISKDTGQLHLAHRLDRNTTGVLLLAKSKLSLSKIQSLFAERKIGKYYWTLTRGCPSPEAGIIDIPIEEGSINGKDRMVLRPYIDRDFNYATRTTRNAKAAITYYKVLAKSGNACLLEVRPDQGIKHQIRVHLGFGLRTPILGDHKYSHLDRLAPQKLPQDMLINLHIRQSKVRTLPMHLHCKLLAIPEIAKIGNTLFIKANLPVHLRENMKSLKLTSKEAKVKISEHF